MHLNEHLFFECSSCARIILEYTFDFYLSIYITICNKETDFGERKNGTKFASYAHMKVIILMIQYFKQRASKKDKC